MTDIETRFAALHLLSQRLCASLPVAELENIRRAVTTGDRAADDESRQMQDEVLKVLDAAIDGARSPG
jgi:hypothetical protein